MGRNHSLHNGLRWSLSNYKYISGLVEISSTFVVDAIEGIFEYAGQFFPAWQVSDGKSRQWYKYNSGIVGFDWPVTDENKETQSDYDKFATDWVKESFPKINSVVSNYLKDYADWPGMYTGKMRYVIQKNLGYGIKAPISKNTGLWTPPGSGVDYHKTRWCIEITDKGVTAYPIYFKKEAGQSSIDEDELYRYDFGLKEDFTPPVEVSKNPYLVFGDSDGELYRYEILSESDVEDVFYYTNFNNIKVLKQTLTPWHSNWAFSYSGEEAQIVFFETKPYLGNWFFYTKRYKIEFNTGELHTDKGSFLYPSSANISVIDEGYLWTSEFDDQLYAPIVEPYQERIFFEVNGSPPPERDCPVYVFYDRDDNEVVLRRKDSPVNIVNDETRIGLLTGDDALGCVIPCIYCDETGSDCQKSLNPNCESASCQRSVAAAEKALVGSLEYRTNYSVSTSSYYCERTFDSKGYEAGTKAGFYYEIDWKEDVVNLESGFTGHVVCNLLNYDYVLMTAYTKSTAYMDHFLPHYEENTDYVRIVIPLQEREGFYHYVGQETKYTDEFNITKFKNDLVIRCNKIKGPYGCQPEVEAVGEFAWMQGPLSVYETEVVGESTSYSEEYKYIGSINGSIVDFDLSGDIIFGDFMTANTVVEMFSGSYILLPHNQSEIIIDNADYEESINSSYRRENLITPYYFCFVGDGTTEEKQKKNVDMNGIQFLRIV